MPVLRLLLVVALGWLAALRPGVADGRAGNRLLADGHPEAAEDAYVRGLARDDVPRAVQAALWHNLGLARHALDRAAEADSAFAEALAAADDPAARARYAYDAGTAALLGGDAPRAVGLLRRALVLDPGRPEARRNYEIARRLADRNDERPEPSDEARRLKEQAERLVAQRKYRDALDLMNDGLARDSTVAAFSDFIDRLGGVVQIEETVGDAPAPADSAARPLPP